MTTPSGVQPLSDTEEGRQDVDLVALRLEGLSASRAVEPGCELSNGEDQC